MGMLTTMYWQWVIDIRLRGNTCQNGWFNYKSDGQTEALPKWLYPVLLTKGADHNTQVQLGHEQSIELASSCHDALATDHRSMEAFGEPHPNSWWDKGVHHRLVTNQCPSGHIHINICYLPSYLFIKVAIFFLWTIVDPRSVTWPFHVDNVHKFLCECLFRKECMLHDCIYTFMFLNVCFSSSSPIEVFYLSGVSAISVTEGRV